jgi:hypothetical protein
MQEVYELVSQLCGHRIHVVGYDSKWGAGDGNMAVR